jgi:hypothetical protein
VRPEADLSGRLARKKAQVLPAQLNLSLPELKKKRA